DLVLVATMRGEPTTAEAGGLTLHITDRAHRGVTLLFATGSPAHLEQLKARAEAIGYTLDERGLHTGETTVAATEKDIYAALGLSFIEPELREGNGEIELASRNRLPRLVDAADIRGILHAHTTESDGVDTLDDMAEAVRSRGYRYFGVSEHSQSAHYAGGLRPEQIELQHAVVDRLNRGYGGDFVIFKGIESDIREDGSLDYPDEILSRFDFIVASVHGKFRLEEAVQTARIIRAVSNPYTTILGHMTGRQLLRRSGYDVDIDAVLRACAAHGVAVEINANPWRLDLDWRWHRRALELGCMMSINPDAHSTAEIDMMRWGVAMARKGGIPKERVLNCLDLPGLQRLLADRRSAIVTHRVR
ncbi:MAG: DNA polymerase/3'-5' exonuclease PolX, partial [Alphaproteobacteria bacterium]|nr:DNA polymerase/3'-5' exonuclease PolX [Alphaproteobacteria bacterium]